MRRRSSGGDLFDFGDRDGAGPDARACSTRWAWPSHDGRLYVADTYNHKIKVVDPPAGASATLAGDGRAGPDGRQRRRFYEPGGLAAAAGRLYVADTNNHALRIVELETGRVATLALPGLKLPIFEGTGRVGHEAVELEAQTVEPGAATLSIAVELPPECQLTEDAPSAVTVMTHDRQVFSLGGERERSFKVPRFPLEVPVTLREGRGLIEVDYAVYYCTRGDRGQCFLKEARVTLPVKVRAGAGRRALATRFKVAS